MIRTRKTAIFTLGALLLLQACGNDAEPPPSEGNDGSNEAEGVILEGSISDEMIEYEKLGAPATDAPRELQRPADGGAVPETGSRDESAAEAE